MGLFDFGGGGGFAGGEFGNVANLLDFLNPIAPAAAADGPGMAGMTPEQLQLMQDKLLNSPAAQGLREQFQGTGVTPPVTDQGLTPTPVQTVPITRPPVVPTLGTPPSSPTTPRLPQATPLDIAQNEAEQRPKLGAALTGNETPPAETAATSPATDFSAKAKDPATLAQALRGVTAPRAPELQRISSPNAPRPTNTIKGGDLQALLLALNAMGSGTAPKVPVLGK